MFLAIEFGFRPNWIPETKTPVLDARGKPDTCWVVPGETYRSMYELESKYTVLGIEPIANMLPPPIGLCVCHLSVAQCA